MADIKKFLDSDGLTYFCKKFQDYPSNEILGAVINAIDNTKVDKVEGKDLSTNDYTNEDKNKLDSSITFNEQNLSDEQQAQARENIAAADSAIEEKVERNSLEIFGADILSRTYRVTFNAVWNGENNSASKSASLAEISFYNANGDACAIETITADSAYGAAYAAGKAIDGDLSTFWSSADDESVQHWLEITFPSAVSPSQLGICLREDYNYGLIDEMTVEGLAEDGTWFEAAHISGEKENWNRQTERRFELKYRLPSLEEKYGKTVAIAADALDRATQTGSNLIISDAIAGAPMRCSCESQITLFGLNLSPVGEVSFTSYKAVQLSTPLAAGTYVFSARCESTDTDSESAMFRIGNKYMSMKHDNVRHSYKFTLTDAADVMYFYAGSSAQNSAGDAAFWREIMLVSGALDMPYEPPIETVVYDAGALMLTAQTNILTADTPMTITYARRNEWLNAVLSATKSAEMNAQTLGYVTPEMFGAVGDGVTDDLAAVQAALDGAQELNLPMRATRSYFVTGSIVIRSNMDVQINSVICTATGAAVQINGENTRVSIRSIKASGVGLELLADGNRCLYNEIDVQKIISGSDCILLYNTNKGAIASNSIRFKLLQAGGDGYSCIHSIWGDRPGYITENSYFGGQCTNADWAVHGADGNSKYYNFQVETSIKGGFFNDGGMQALIVGARYAESQRDGEYPFLKIKTADELPNTSASAVTNLRFIGCNGLEVNEIDVSEVSTVIYQANNPDRKWTLGSNGSLGYIDCRIVGYAETGSDNYTIPQHFADGALVWGNCLIFQGVPRRRYLVEQSLDLRTIGVDTPALPTIFEIGCADCEIWLHPTYCFMGVDRFNVIQTAEHTATIYDYYSGGVIFDGAGLGAGEYEVETYMDVGYSFAFIDGEGMAWRVRRISGSGGDSGSSGGETTETLTAGNIDNMNVSTFENKLVSEVET